MFSHNQLLGRRFFFFFFFFFFLFGVHHWHKVLQSDRPRRGIVRTKIKQVEEVFFWSFFHSWWYILFSWEFLEMEDVNFFPHMGFYGMSLEHMFIFLPGKKELHYR